MKTTSNASLKPYNTFGIDARAKVLCEVHSIGDLREALALAGSETQMMILGGGSNILFTSDYDGMVILNRIDGISVVDEDEIHVYVRAGGGEPWHGLVRWCVERNYGGMENMSLIPGCVGAGPIQNIGAYGRELKDIFFELDAVHIETGKVRTFSLADCSFGYRESIFKKKYRDQYVIAMVTFRLDKDPVVDTKYGSISDELAKRGIEKPTIRDVSDVVIAIRQSKLPETDVLGNAGSFFKNPEIPADEFEAIRKKYPEARGFPGNGGKIKLYAGWLIEQCGWKGKRVGNTGAHKDQALVLVNYGGATGQEILDLAGRIRESVKKQFGVEMEMEVNLV